MKMDLREIGIGGVNWIGLVQDSGCSGRHYKFLGLSSGPPPVKAHFLIEFHSPILSPQSIPEPMFLFQNLMERYKFICRHCSFARVHSESDV
jgi:hypothetical protein